MQSITRGEIISAQTMTKADILLLDVDGVVTDRYARVSMPVVLELLRLSRSGVKMAFITGRSGTWVRRNLMGKVRDGKNMLFLCEFGSVIVGRPAKNRAMPRRYVKTARKIAGMFPAIKYDNTKETMISMEASLRLPDAESQLVAAERMLRLMVKGDPRFKVLRSTYAVDVLDGRVGKGKAARFALKEFGGHPGKRIVVIGDSAADLKMGLPGCTFFWVGEKKPESERAKFRIIATRKKFSDGALFVLKRMAEAR